MNFLFSHSITASLADEITVLLNFIDHDEVLFVFIYPQRFRSTCHKDSIAGSQGA